MANNTPNLETIAEVIEYFISLFSIGSPITQHDVFHAMTGLGIGLYDEQDLLAFQCGLNNNLWSDTKKYLRVMYRKIKNLVSGTDKLVGGATASDLALQKFKDIQIAVPRISRKEAKAFYKLGKQQRAKISFLSRDKYASLQYTPNSQIETLRLADIDCSEEAHALKERFMTPERLAIELKLAQAFEEASQAKRGRPMFIDGTPWRNRGVGAKMLAQMGLK